MKIFYSLDRSGPKNIELSLKELLGKLVILQIKLSKKKIIETKIIFFSQFLISGSTVTLKVALQLETLLIDLEEAKKKVGLYIYYIKRSIHSVMASLRKIPGRILRSRRRLLAIIFFGIYSIPGIVGARSWSFSLYEENRYRINDRARIIRIFHSPYDLTTLFGTIPEIREVPEVPAKKSRPLLSSWRFWNWGKKKKTPRLLGPTWKIRKDRYLKKLRERDRKEAEEVARMHAFPVMAEIEPGPYTLARARVIYLYSQGKSKRTYRIIDAIDTMRFMFIFNDQKDAKERAVFLVDWAYRGHKIWLCQRQMAKDAPYPPNFPYEMHLHIVEMVRIIGRHRGFNDYG
jgi:hypothetical protein